MSWTSPVNGHAVYKDKDNFVQHLLDEKKKTDAKIILVQQEIEDMIKEKQEELKLLQVRQKALAESFTAVMGEGRHEYQDKVIVVKIPRRYSLGADGLSYVRDTYKKAEYRKIVEKYFRIDPKEKTATLNKAFEEIEPDTKEGQFLMTLKDLRKEKTSNPVVEIKDGN